MVLCITCGIVISVVEVYVYLLAEVREVLLCGVASPVRHPVWLQEPGPGYLSQGQATVNLVLSIIKIPTRSLSVKGLGGGHYSGGSLSLSAPL